jgi:hypothetical protein
MFAVTVEERPMTARGNTMAIGIRNGCRYHGTSAGTVTGLRKSTT